MSNVLFGGLLYAAMLFSCTVFAQKQDSSFDLRHEKHLAVIERDSTLLNNLQPPYRHNSFETYFAHPEKKYKRPAITSKPLSAKALVLPATLIAFGGYTFANNDLKNLNLKIREEVWEERNNNKILHIDNYSRYAPAVAVYALNLAGIKGKNNFFDRSMLFGMSTLIGNEIVSFVKRTTNVYRPDSSNRRSFPSGHTAQAFISAEFLRQEYKDVSPWYGIAGYAIAVGTGYLRMYNNKHWLNDVVAGAGVGILSTRISYWLYPKLKNTFLYRHNSGTVLMPTYKNGAVGIGMIKTF